MATALATHPTSNSALVASTPQFTVNRTDLVRELGLALGAVERRTTIPILGNVKLEASDFGHLAITATDLDIGLSCQCPATVRVPGVATLPAKRLLDYVRLLPDGEVNVKFTENQWATITAGRSKTRIAGMSAESFPEIPKPRETACSIPLKTIQRMIQQTAYAISTEESRFTLNGALFEMGTGTLRMIATDGHRLTLANGTGEVRLEGKNLIPRKALVELLRLAGVVAPDATAEFSTDENHIFFTIGDRILQSRRPTGNFPDYSRVVPASFQGTATVNRLQLRDALNRVRGFSDERSRAIRVVISDGQVAASASAMETGESEDSVPAEVTGAVTIGFNADYLIDFLGATDAEHVVLSFGGDKAAIQLTPAGADSECLCVVMPLRI
ncbi:DnaN DNA polymerase sliding clamp subunit (PCNA homolog) [uncultured Caudovirales phage]|uniref:DnaN DNA polymerase sliding clamp subunit (PCNA homolog) n=1 Tax=uncultured Caudovirales phage TaxID=2100421 RepID=A0A6J5LB46_9CAUD|nr:DnaN DNA polymerase sliding clamp subunit (PCNA homolog) [uncultured Caudovirales phage]